MRMFDPVVDKIIDLISVQIRKSPFRESGYLFKRIDKIFKKRIHNIIVPPDSIAAI